MALILLRHTQVAVPAGTCYGQADVPLRDPAEPSFDAVALRLSELLAEMGAQRVPARLSRIVSSPLQRAYALAQWLGSQAGLPVQQDPRWMELNFGDWEGQRWEQVPRAQSDEWAKDVLRRAPPGGETRAALEVRVMAALAELAETAADPAQAVLVVAHAGPIRVALGAALSDVLTDVSAVPLDFGGLCWLEPQPGSAWALRALNR